VAAVGFLGVFWLKVDAIGFTPNNPKLITSIDVSKNANNVPYGWIQWQWS